MTNLDAFTRAYIECALWSSNDESTPSGGEPLDRNYSIDDIAPETLATVTADCQAFQADNADLLARWYEAGESIERAGHDFWLTRNRHGAGYWDRWNDSTDQGKIGRELTDLAHAYGEVNLYIGDDGRIHA